jgi:DNA modification methylase
VNFEPRVINQQENYPLVNREDSSTVFSALSKVNWAFSDDDTSYLTHDIHPYAAKFIPQIPATLITMLSLPGELIWDPFGGSGTTALEASLLGRNVISTDANPLSMVIGQAKTSVLTFDEEAELVAWSKSIEVLNRDAANIESALAQSMLSWMPFIPEIPNIERWFHSTAVNELAYLRWYIQEKLTERQKAISEAAFSRTVLKVSYQDGETRYTAKKKNVDVGTTFQTFVRELKVCLEKMRQLRQVSRNIDARFAVVDLRQQFDDNAPFSKNSVSLIVTSPPYPNAYDYHLYHRFRLFWLGYDPRMLAKVEVGSHLRHQKEATGFDQYVEEMTLCLRNFWWALQPGCYAVLVVGDGIFKSVTYSTAEELGKVAVNLGFELVGIIEREIHRTKRTFTSAARRANQEQLLIIRKPVEPKSEMLLYPPNYRLWDYEVDLRRREIVAVTGLPPRTITSDLWVIESPSEETSTFIKRLAFTHRYQNGTPREHLTWQALLENGENTKGTTRKDSTYLTHGIHPYKGKFYPQLVKSLINVAGLSSGQTLLDVFCGSGTTLLEGYLNGLRTIGCDFNPLAAKIAHVKTQMPTIESDVRERWLEVFLKALDCSTNVATTQQWLDSYNIDAQKEILSWFPASVVEKLAVVGTAIAQVENGIVREFLEIVLSSIVRQISQQDPRDLRIRRRKPTIEDAPVIELLLENLELQRRKLQHFDSVKSLLPLSPKTALVWNGDSRELEGYSAHGVELSSVDAVITSPPYATALPYIDTDRLSILLLFGLPARERSSVETDLTGTREINPSNRKRYDSLIAKGDFGLIESEVARNIIRLMHEANSKEEVGFRRRDRAALLYKYFEDMTGVLQTVDQLLKPSGQAFFVLGNNMTQINGNQVEISSTSALKDIASQQGWQFVDEIFISVTRENYAHAKNSITENSILGFRK